LAKGCLSLEPQQKGHVVSKVVANSGANNKTDSRCHNFGLDKAASDSAQQAKTYNVNKYDSTSPLV